MKNVTKNNMIEHLGNLENTKFHQWDYYTPSDDAWGKEEGKKNIVLNEARWLRNLLYLEGVFIGPVCNYYETTWVYQ